MSILRFPQNLKHGLLFLGLLITSCFNATLAQSNYDVEVKVWYGGVNDHGNFTGDGYPPGANKGFLPAFEFFEGNEVWVLIKNKKNKPLVLSSGQTAIHLWLSKYNNGSGNSLGLSGTEKIYDFGTTVVIQPSWTWVKHKIKLTGVSKRITDLQLRNTDRLGSLVIETDLIRYPANKSYENGGGLMSENFSILVVKNQSATTTNVNTPTTTSNVTAVSNQNASIQTTELFNYIQQNNYTKAEELVLKNTTDINGKDVKNGRAAIHYAALNDDKDMIELLKDKGNADLNITDNQGKTALDLALEGSKFKAALALLNNNADASKANAGLDRVLATQNMEILKLMLQNGANGETAIKKSIASDNVETMKFVFENSSARASNALFEEAINKRSTKCAIGLLQNGVDKNQAMDFVIRSRNKDMVDLVLNTGVDVTTANKALTFFVEQRDVAKAESAITNNQADATVAMPAAVKSNNVQMVQMLLRNHADPNDQMDEASAAGNNEMVTAFLTAGSNPDNGVKPAADNDKIATLQILLDNKGDANIAMPIAIKKNNTSMVQMCLTAGKPADVYRSEYVITACENSNIDILNALLLAGAPADPGLTISVSKADLKMVEALIKGGASVTRPDYMIKAAELNNANLVKLLLDAGADPNPGLVIAGEKGNTDMVDMLLAKGAQANAAAMLAGVKGGVVAIVEKLISKGGNAKEAGLVKASVMHDNPALTTLLLDKGADPKEGVATCIKEDKPKALAVLIDKGADVKNPAILVEAVKNGFAEVAKALIDKGGADPAYLDERKSSLMHIAASKGHQAMIPLLVSYKVDINAKDVDGNTPLLQAMISRDKEPQMKNEGLVLTVIRLLLNGGADPNIINKNGDAPLHLLCKGDMKNSIREDCIEALLAKGANACAVDKKNNTPREYLPVMEGGPRKKLKNAMKDGGCK